MTTAPHQHFAPVSAPADDELQLLDAYWRTANYLAVGMIYLQGNALLKEPLRPEHIKPRLLGHWGSSPGQAFIWTHANRLIKKYDLDMIYMSAGSEVRTIYQGDVIVGRLAMGAGTLNPACAIELQAAD
jgi:xylulose-5-phosphate/fructose-6-phosphate phosphoketolase